MIDVRQSMGAAPQAPAQPQYQPQQPQPQAQAPAAVQPQQPVYAQPVAQAAAQPATPPAPKKKGCSASGSVEKTTAVRLSHLQSRRTALQRTPHWQHLRLWSSSRCRLSHWHSLRQDDQITGSCLRTSRANRNRFLPRQPKPFWRPSWSRHQNQFHSSTRHNRWPRSLQLRERWLRGSAVCGYSGSDPTASGEIPALDFTAPIQDPDHDQIELGNPSPLSPAVPPVAAVPAKPADPFSDDALFPAEAPAAPAAIAEGPVLGELSPVTTAQEPVSPEPVQQEPAQEVVSSDPPCRRADSARCRRSS